MGVFQGWKMGARRRLLLISPPRVSCFKTYHETENRLSFFVPARVGMGSEWVGKCYVLHWFQCEIHKILTHISANHTVTPYCMKTDNEIEKLTKFLGAGESRNGVGMCWNM